MLMQLKPCGCRLAGLAEAFSAEEREQDRYGLHAEAGDAVQQLALLFQVGIAVGFPLDFRVDVLE
jgi:hypothetical protein